MTNLADLRAKAEAAAWPLTRDECLSLIDIADAARDAYAVLVEYHEDLPVTFLLGDKLAVLDTNEERK